MEDDDRLLIQQLREIGDEPCRQLADSLETAYESPEEILRVFDELRPILGEQSFRTIDEMLRAGRQIGRALLANRQGVPDDPDRR